MVVCLPSMKESQGFNKSYDTFVFMVQAHNRIFGNPCNIEMLNFLYYGKTFKIVGFYFYRGLHGSLKQV